MKMKPSQFTEYYATGKYEDNIQFSRFKQRVASIEQTKKKSEKNLHKEAVFNVKPHFDSPFGSPTRSKRGSLPQLPSIDKPNTPEKINLPKLGRKIMSKSEFKTRLSNSPDQKQSPTQDYGSKQGTILLEKVSRVTRNPDTILGSEKAMTRVPSIERIDVPKYLVHPSNRMEYEDTEQTIPQKNVPKIGPQYNLSSRLGWVSVNKNENCDRKNAPEVSKIPLSPEQKYQFKPNWMQTLPKSLTNKNIPTVSSPQKAGKYDYGAESQFKKNAWSHLIGGYKEEHERSVFQYGVYRTNLNTKNHTLEATRDELNANRKLHKKRDSSEPHGVATNQYYNVSYKPMQFLHWKEPQPPSHLNGPQRHSINDCTYGITSMAELPTRNNNAKLAMPHVRSNSEVNIKPFSRHVDNNYSALTLS